MSLSDAAKARTEAAFKRKEEQARDGANAWAEYEAKSRAIAKNMERLRALRLAKEAAARPHPQSSNGAEPVTQSPASATTTPDREGSETERSQRSRTKHERFQASAPQHLNRRPLRPAQPRAPKARRRVMNRH